MAAVASGLLLSSSFAPLEWGGVAWVALVPLILACEGQRWRRAAGLGFLAGFAHWITTLHWITHVTVAGWVALALYCALYVVPLAVFVARWPVVECGRAGSGLARMLGGAAVWVAAEYLRSSLFTGFPWNALGVSQWRNLALLQHAEWGGVYVLSFLVVWVNLAAAGILRRARRTPAASPLRRLSLEGGVTLALVLFAGLSGWGLFRRVPAPDAVVRLALIQPSVPQNVKWTPEFMAGVYARLEELTRLAAAAGPDLIVWPETAVPEDLRTSETGLAMVGRLTEAGPPLLAGALATGVREDGRPLVFNAAYLIRDGGVIAQEYDKQHLVIFGEYVPFAEVLPVLRNLVPMDYDLERGTRPVVFELVRPPVRFSTTICFEDTVAPLVARFTRAGARLLINQTNDAWFDFSSGSSQHLPHSVLRAVENRLPMARCGNSGITAWIDERGRVRGRLAHYGPGPSLQAGFLQAEIPYHAGAIPPTFYARQGDVLAQGCLGLAVVLFGWLAWRGRPGGQTQS